MKNYRKQTIHLALLALCISAFFACAPVYIPNSVNAPLFTDKGQFKAQVGTGISGWDPQLAYSITNHLGIMTNLSFANRTGADSTKDFHKHEFYEGGVGYFISPQSWMVLEAYGGYGVGRVKGYFDSGIFQKTADGKYQRMFIQPTFGIVTKYFESSISFRFSFVDMHVNDASSLLKDGYTPYFEPAITLKGGPNRFKFYTQFGFSERLGDHTFYYDYQPFMFTIGMQLTLGKKVHFNK